MGKYGNKANDAEGNKKPKIAVTNISNKEWRTMKPSKKNS
ncbi:hypothetical protein GCM10027340_08070 [Marinomonas epiphytica]